MDLEIVGRRGNAIIVAVSFDDKGGGGGDWVVSIVKDVVRDMVTNGELQAVSQPTSPKSESPTLAADDLADLGGVMGMFRSKE